MWGGGLEDAPPPPAPSEPAASSPRASRAEPSNPGNVWRQKDKKQDEFVIGDWQLLLKCPIGLDFATLYLCTKGLDTQVCSGANCLSVVLT